jgi:site-specific DNA recombinase
MSVKNGHKIGPPLKFAALIRVSTEKQESKGESLRTQETQIKNAVALLGGKIVVTYAGQEHATPGWEREQLTKLLKDAPTGKFNAVILADATRWLR